MKICILIFILFPVAGVVADDKPVFRTDGNPDKSLPWFEPLDGEFPPEKYAHYVAGELIGFDHMERTLKLRVDRQDGRGGKDQAIDAEMLPYGSIYYRNAPAALRDVPRRAGYPRQVRRQAGTSYAGKLQDVRAKSDRMG